MNRNELRGASRRTDAPLSSEASVLEQRIQWLENCVLILLALSFLLAVCISWWFGLGLILTLALVHAQAKQRWFGDQSC